jgi:hypothetical protein
MELKQSHMIDIPWALLEGIKTLPLRREVEHCGAPFFVSPFDFHAICPLCGTHIKVRACSGVTEVEDVFDAVFEWLNQPGAADVARRRQEEIASDQVDDE